MVLAHNIADGGRTQDVQISQGVTFDSMLLSSDTLIGLQNSGFYKPSPIQLHGIPLGKCGFDLLLEAKSGTGKTAVFSVIALEQFDISKGLQTVILAPTREIAAQICDVIKQIGSHYNGLKVEVVMGGLPIHEDIAKFKTNDVHIVVGSPGRLRHLIQNKHIDISTVRLLVLDEADKLLEKSFLLDINFIYSILPKEKQVILSSATYPTETKNIIKHYVQSAQHVCPDSNCILVGITQKLTVVKFHSNIVLQTKYRFEELLKILSKHAFKQCLIFCNYQARVAEVYKLLHKHKWPAEQLYGQQEQLERLDALRSLQEYKCRILICTDLAARGIDASNVDLIINFEPPYEWQTYLHRIGRAGRFGSYGKAITILSKGKEEQNFREILSTIKMPINLTKLWEENDQIKSADGLETSSILQEPEPYIEESIPVNFKTTGKCEILWSALTVDKREIFSDVEDFENLCSSYNSFKEQVESFSDLLDSLKRHQSAVNETNNLYEHESLPSPENSTLISTEKIKENVINRTKHSANTEINNNNCGKSSKTLKVSNLDTKKGHLLNLKNSTESERKKEGTKVFNYECEDTNSLEAALLNAGLPTAFGKPKLTKKETKVKYSKCDSYVHMNQNKDFHYLEKSKNSNEQSPSYRDVKDLDTSQNSNFNNKSRAKSRKSEIIPRSRYDSCYKSGTNSKYNNKHINGSETSDNSEEESYSSATNSSYINWYNNLKFRTKEVEHAIYVQEMLKLQSQTK